MTACLGRNDVPELPSLIGCVTSGTAQSWAVISSDDRYRYLLGRRWGTGSLLAFVMLNPSTADALKPDPTITKCIGFATRLGYGGIVVANLFAWRATDPKELNQHGRAILGTENERAVEIALGDPTGLAVMAWGRLPSKWVREQAIIPVHRALRLANRLGGARSLGRTKTGEPRHPLMLPYAAPLELYP